VTPAQRHRAGTLADVAASAIAGRAREVTRQLELHGFAAFQPDPRHPDAMSSIRSPWGREIRDDDTTEDFGHAFMLDENVVR
jgi:hypothetical protein